MDQPYLRAANSIGLRRFEAGQQVPMRGGAGHREARGGDLLRQPSRIAQVDVLGVGAHAPRNAGDAADLCSRESSLCHRRLLSHMEYKDNTSITLLVKSNLGPARPASMGPTKWPATTPHRAPAQPSTGRPGAGPRQLSWFRAGAFRWRWGRTLGRIVWAHGGAQGPRVAGMAPNTYSPPTGK